MTNLFWYEGGPTEGHKDLRFRSSSVDHSLYLPFLPPSHLILQILSWVWWKRMLVWIWPPAYFPSCQALRGKEPVEHNSPVRMIWVSWHGRKEEGEEGKTCRYEESSLNTQRKRRQGFTTRMKQSTRNTRTTRKTNTRQMKKIGSMTRREKRGS